MSYTMNIQMEIHDRDALMAACERLRLKVEEGTFAFYDTRTTGKKFTGLGVFLPNWQYPVVINDDGSISFDNYNGEWGKIEELNKLKAFYGLEKAKIEAYRKGYSVFESVNEITKNPVLRIRVGV